MHTSFIAASAAILLSSLATAATAQPVERPLAPDSSAWTLTADKIDPANYYGETVANGMIGIVSTPIPFKSKQTLINGAYEVLDENLPSGIVSTFNFLSLSLSIDGEVIKGLDQITNLRQRLHMRKAALEVAFDFKDKASITYSVRALRQMPYTGLLEIGIAARKPITIAVTSRMDTPEELIDVKAYNKIVGSYLYDADPREARLLHAVRAKTRFGRHTIAAAQGFLFEEPLITAPKVLPEPNGIAFNKTLAQGSSYHFSLAGSSLTSAHVKDPLSESQRLTIYAMVQSTRELIAVHERQWNELWKGDIVIEGDDGTQRDIRSMLYHLYSSVREGTHYSIPPMGLSGTGYFGHIFWDADVWMLPTLIALQPSLAQSMLDYRYDRLPAARANALAHGFRGALFPWESTESGEEETLGFLTGPTQHHITAGIAIVAWKYYCATQDKRWLREKGWPLIKETADFWLSRVERNGPGRYDIKNVVAADEYAELVDNNAFTNAAAKENLAAATAAAKVLGLPADPDWETVRTNIPILKFPDGVTREHATYNGEKIKQGDANLLAYPLREITDRDAIVRDLDYYLRRYDSVIGPSYSKAAFAILHQKVGQTQRAFEVFKDGYRPTQRPPFGTLAECPTCNSPYFVTSAGSFLQTMLYGFGGLEVTDQGIRQTSAGKLPAGWRSLTLTGIGPGRRTFIVK